MLAYTSSDIQAGIPGYMLMLEIFNSLLFLFVGYYLGRHHNDPEIATKTIKRIKKIISPTKSGVIDYASQADVDYHGSEEEKADEARSKLFREQFKP